MANYVAYYRVSTDQQGETGLGLDAQRTAVAQHLNGVAPLAEFQEIESGKKHTNRPQLAAAIDLCRRKRATLVIAKLDRLARNVHFISGLLEGKVDFVCCDNPHANKAMLQMLAVFGEHEREMISARTKAALAEVKKRGTRLGNPKWKKTIHRAWDARRSTPPPKVIKIMQQQRSQGCSYRAIADYLNDELGLRTPKGFRWHNETVRDILNRSMKVQA